MSWTDRLQSASFRGIEFKYEQISRSGGRRVAVHEYPFADDPYPEDMGLKANEFTISAYFIGSNYDLLASAFEQQLDKKGQGELNLPLSGSQQVQLQTWQRTDTTAQGGMARFNLQFVQAGTKRYPSTEGNAQADLITSLNTLNTTISANFSSDLATMRSDRSSADFEIAEQLSTVSTL